MADNDYPPPNPSPPPSGWPPPQPNWPPQQPNQPPNWPPQNPPPAWPPPPGGYYAPLPPQGPAVNAPLILVFGILGIFFALICGLGGIFGTIAWIMGNGALETLDQAGDPLSQRGMVVGGRICGMVATGIMALSLLAFVVMLAFGLASSSSHP